MAELSTFPQEQLSPTVYRRLSGFAVVSLAIGGLFAVGVLGMAIWGMRDRSPLLLPGWVPVLPLIGAALAVTAILFIRNSEGSLAGAKIAQAGLWLNLLVVLGYWAYYAALSIAVSKQADDFSQAWLTKLAEQNLGGAVLDTQDPSLRLKIRANDSAAINEKLRMQFAAGSAREGVIKKPLDAFRGNSIARILLQAGPTAKIKALGIKDWGFKNGGYQVQRIYQVTTTEGVHELKITVKGLESKTHEFEGRQWQLVYGPESAPVSFIPSPVGQNMEKISAHAGRFISLWGAALVQQNFGIGYALTLDPEERARYLKTFAPPRLAGAVAAELLPLEGTPWGMHAAMLQGILFEFNMLVTGADLATRFQQRHLFKTDNLQADDEEIRQLVRQAFEGVQGGAPGKTRLMQVVEVTPSASQSWAYKDNKLQLAFDAKFWFAASGAKDMRGLQQAATVTVEAAADPANPPKDIVWRIVDVDLTYSTDPSKSGPMGPGMPKMNSGEMQKAMQKGGR